MMLGRYNEPIKTDAGEGCRCQIRGLLLVLKEAEREHEGEC